MFYSIFDTGTKDYLTTGLNSTTKEDAINDGFDFISEGSDESEEFLDSLTLEDKESHLTGMGYIIDEHEEELPEDRELNKILQRGMKTFEDLNNLLKGDSNKS